TGCALTYWRARPSIPQKFLRLVCVSVSFPRRRRPVWRPVVRLSAAGEGGSSVTQQNPQAQNHKIPKFCKVFAKNKRNQKVRQIIF
ncbi:hypothetical protein Q4577_19905, partial [Marinovum sp. 2_MG-2023]|uniref:hypothetical protein n=1 Tax=unclassified Marinovum TaxID=2647166 RepID=UPI0026E3C184